LGRALSEGRQGTPGSRCQHNVEDCVEVAEQEDEARNDTATEDDSENSQKD